MSTHQWIFQCQHGPDECKGNLIEVPISNISSNICNMSSFFVNWHVNFLLFLHSKQTCAIHILQKVDAYFPFLHCIEGSEDLPEKSAPIVSNYCVLRVQWRNSKIPFIDLISNFLRLKAEVKMNIMNTWLDLLIAVCEETEHPVRTNRKLYKKSAGEPTRTRNGN